MTPPVLGRRQFLFACAAAGGAAIAGWWFGSAAAQPQTADADGPSPPPALHPAVRVERLAAGVRLTRDGAGCEVNAAGAAVIALLDGRRDFDAICVAAAPGGTRSGAGDEAVARLLAGLSELGLLRATFRAWVVEEA